MTMYLLLWARIPQNKWHSHHSKQESEMQYLDANSKTREWSLFIFKANLGDITVIFISQYNITAIQVYTPASNAEKAEVEWFYEDLQDFLELTPTHTHTDTHTHKDVLFIIGDLNAKVRSQEIPGVTGKFGLGVQNEAGQRLTVLPRECTGYSKHPLPTT